MFLNAHLKVIINNAVLHTVVSVQTRNESQNIGSSCDLVVPLNCRIELAAFVPGVLLGGGGLFLTDQVKNLFNVGDKIKIIAWYDGYTDVNVFEGFIYDFVLGNPTTIKCLDWVYKLKLGTVHFSEKSIGLVNMVKKYLLPGTGITLMKNSVDFNLQNMTYGFMSPAAVLEKLKGDMGLNISLKHDKLYLNVASNTEAVVRYNTGINVIKADLQQPDSVMRRIGIRAWFVRPDGKKDSLETGDMGGEVKDAWFHNVQNVGGIYKKLAAEALKRNSMYKYSGTIETLLYPNCHLFDKCLYTDLRYPDRNGNYVITGMDFSIDDKGFRRKLRLSFLADLQHNQYA